MMMTMTMMTMADGRLMDDDDDCWWWWLMMMMIIDDDDDWWWCWLMMMMLMLMIDDDDDDDWWWWWLMMMLIADWWWCWCWLVVSHFHMLTVTGYVAWRLFNMVPRPSCWAYVELASSERGTSPAVASSASCRRTWRPSTVLHLITADAWRSLDPREYLCVVSMITWGFHNVTQHKATHAVPLTCRQHLRTCKKNTTQF